MIRALNTSSDGHAVYGFTIRGIAVLAAGAGVIATAAVFAWIAFGHANRAIDESKASRANSILIACREANDRHHEALPFVIGLVKTSKPRFQAERQARDEAIAALNPPAVPNQLGFPPPIPPPPTPLPRTAGGRIELQQIRNFTQIIAPAYDCRARLRKFTSP